MMVYDFRDKRDHVVKMVLTVSKDKLVPPDQWQVQT